jgi:hypothetical protein
MHQSKLAAKPRRQLTTKEKEQRPHIYDKCKCGQMKARIAKQCNDCKIRSKKTVVSAHVFKINSKFCRYIPLTRGQAAIVYSWRYKELSQYEWYASLLPKLGIFYAFRNIIKSDGTKTTISMHRQIIGGGSERIDHHNHNGCDNRDENLRPCTPGQNGANTKCRSKSGFKGVYAIARNKVNPWASRITINNKTHWLGNFKKREEAARAYDRAAIRAFGEFAHLNFTVTDYVN